MDDIASNVAKLASKATTWKGLSIQGKIDILRNCLENMAKDDNGLGIQDLSDNIVGVQNLTVLEHGKIEAYTQAFVFYGICCGRLKAIISSLEILRDSGKPPSVKIASVPSQSGAQVVKVYPRSVLDKFSMPAAVGVSGEIWLKEGEESKPIPTSLSEGDDGFSLVLGAGNQEFLFFCDILDRMFLHDEVVVAKHHPLRPHLHEVYSAIFSPLIKDGFLLSIKDSGLALTEMLTSHSALRHIHLTGGNATHDAILARNPNTPFTSELGCVTPWIIIPDPEDAVAPTTSTSTSTSLPLSGDSSKSKSGWDDKALAHHAKHLAMALKGNGSANCLSPKVLVIPRRWVHRDAFLHHLRRACAELPASGWYYPGAQQRFERFKAEYEGEGSCGSCEVFSTSMKGGSHADAGEDAVSLCALLHVGVDERNEGGNRYALINEAFAPVLAIVELSCPSDIQNGENSHPPHSTTQKLGPEYVRSFVAVATKFCNEEVWGTLSCSVFCPDPAGRLRGPLEQAVAGLEYGCVCVNVWSAMAYGINECTWGAHADKYVARPGHGGSGNGVVGNSLMLPKSRIIKSVVRAPFVHPLQPVGDFPPLVLIEVLAEVTRKPIVRAIWSVLKILVGKLCGWGK